MQFGFRGNFTLPMGPFCTLSRFDTWKYGRETEVGARFFSPVSEFLFPRIRVFHRDLTALSFLGISFRHAVQDIYQQVWHSGKQ